MTEMFNGSSEMSCNFDMKHICMCMCMKRLSVKMYVIYILRNMKGYHTNHHFNSI